MLEGRAMKKRLALGVAVLGLAACVIVISCWLYWRAELKPTRDLERLLGGDAGIGISSISISGPGITIEMRDRTTSFEATTSHCNVECSICDDVGNVAFSLSSSAKFVATLSNRGGVAIWDTLTTKTLASWKPALFSKEVGRTYPGGQATGLCFDSTNDDVIYVCNTDGIFSLDWKTKAEPKTIIRFTRRMARELS
jgi:WD40 repeat protein